MIELPERSVEVKLKSMFDLRALSMSLRDAYLKQRETEFFAWFERLKQGRMQLPFNHATLEGLRYAFRMTWIKNDFVAIVQAGQNLPKDVLQREPLLSAYIAESLEEIKKQDERNYAHANSGVSV